MKTITIRELFDCPPSYGGTQYVLATEAEQIQLERDEAVKIIKRMHPYWMPDSTEREEMLAFLARMKEVKS